MSGSFVMESRTFSIYVKVLQGEGDGTLVYIDPQGHIHVGGGDPGPLRQQIAAAAKQLEAGVGALAHVFEGRRAAVPA